MLISSFSGCESTSFPFFLLFPLFPESFLLATGDGLTALLAFPADSRSGHFSTPVQEMPASFTSPSLKSGMTHVLLSFIAIRAADAAPIEFATAHRTLLVEHLQATG